MDDFNAPIERYSRGNTKTTALKPWQSRNEAGVVVTDKFRCWDGLLGCEEFKSEKLFKWHKLLCDQCAQALTMRFSVPQSEAELIALLVNQDAGLFRMAKYFKVSEEKTKPLEKAQEMHLKRLFDSVNKCKNRHEIEAVNKAYRDWFHAEIGLEPESPKPVKGFTAAAHGLPVGDI